MLRGMEIKVITKNIEREVSNGSTSAKNINNEELKQKNILKVKSRILLTKTTELLITIPLQVII